MLCEGTTLWNALDKKLVHAQSPTDLKKIVTILEWCYMFMYGM